MCVCVCACVSVCVCVWVCVNCRICGSGAGGPGVGRGGVVLVWDSAGGGRREGAVLVSAVLEVEGCPEGWC